MPSDERRLPALIAAMSRPEFYSERPAEVELIQTHISCVFLAGEFVYKVRKPVRFAFLDYSTLEQRYHFSQEEVRLNRRLAPDIYLGIFSIRHQGDGFTLGEQASSFSDSDVAEYAVKMRRLPEDRILERLIVGKRARKDDIARIASRLAQFHAEASNDRADVYGIPAAVSKAVLGNLNECESCVGQTLSRQQFDEISNFLHRFIENNQHLFMERIAQGRVRECHGDLRCEHICLIDGIVAFDCVEFNESFRYCDVASEIAFLAMDLERFGASDLADTLVATYIEKTGDTAMPELLRFYKCYRAAVRGKVSTLKALESEVPDDERERAKATALTCFRLAHRYATGAAPALVLVCGLSGTGKSTIAGALARRIGFRVFNSDVIRKRMMGVGQAERASAQYSGGIYDARANELTYGALAAEAERSLREGKGVIVDATFKDSANRRRFAELGARANVPVLIVECRADETEVHRRLLERQKRPDSVSDATWEVYLRQKTEFAPITEADSRHHLIVDSTQDPAEIAIRIEEFHDQIH